MEGPALPGASSACKHSGLSDEDGAAGTVPSVPLASPSRALRLPLGRDRVCDGVKVSVVPCWGWNLSPLQGLEEAFPSRMGHYIAGHLLAGSDKCPPSKSRTWYPSVLSCGDWICPSTSSPLMGTCVGDALAECFPGVSSSGWQSSGLEGVWGQSCAHQWCFVLLLLCLAGTVAWPGVGVGFQSPMKLSHSLWLLWQLCGCHCAGLMTLEVISHRATTPVSLSL